METILAGLLTVLLIGVVCFGAAFLCFAGVLRMLFGKGWFGTLKGFTKKTAQKMKGEFNAD